MSSRSPEKADKKSHPTGGLVLIHRNSNSELGRLLAGDAITPFTVPGFPGPHDGEWLTFNEAALTLYSDYIRGVNPRRDVTAGREHDAWLNANDEDRLAFILRRKIQCNSYLQDLVATSNDTFLFVDESQTTLSRFRWMEKELNHLRRYFRKSFAQGHQQPYIRMGARRPYIWR